MAIQYRSEEPETPAEAFRRVYGDCVLDGMERNAAEARGRRAAFLVNLTQTGVVIEAARRTGVSTWIVYKHWMKDPEFRAAHEEAVEDSKGVIEAELYRRGVEGYQEPVIFQGQPTMLVDKDTGEERMFTVRKYSDGCLLALAKARMPERFRENSKVEHDVKGSGVLVVPAAVDPESWAKAAEEHARAQAERARREAERSK